MENKLILCYKEKKKEMPSFPSTYEELKKYFLKLFCEEKPSENIVFYYDKNTDNRNLNIIEENIESFSQIMNDILNLINPIILIYDAETKKEENDDACKHQNIHLNVVLNNMKTADSQNISSIHGEESNKICNSYFSAEKSEKEIKFEEELSIINLLEEKKINKLEKQLKEVKEKNFLIIQNLKELKENKILLENQLKDKNEIIEKLEKNTKEEEGKIKILKESKQLSNQDNEKLEQLQKENIKQNQIIADLNNRINKIEHQLNLQKNKEEKKRYPKEIEGINEELKSNIQKTLVFEIEKENIDNKLKDGNQKKEKYINNVKKTKNENKIKNIEKIEQYKKNEEQLNKIQQEKIIINKICLDKEIIQKLEKEKNEFKQKYEKELIDNQKNKLKKELREKQRDNLIKKNQKQIEKYEKQISDLNNQNIEKNEKIKNFNNEKFHIIKNTIENSSKILEKKLEGILSSFEEKIDKEFIGRYDKKTNDINDYYKKKLEEIDNI